MKKGLLAGFAALLICAFPAGCFGQEESETIHSGDWEYRLNEDGTAAIAGWNKDGESVVIPEEIDGLKVTAIGEFAFDTNSGLEEVTVPDTVTRIEMDAFNQCGSLTSIDLPDGITEIGDYAFHLCGSLVDVEIPRSVTRIGTKAFCTCAFTSITIPDAVEEIGTWAFGNCHNLETIEVSEENENFMVANDALIEKKTMTLICYPAGLTEPKYEVAEGVLRIGDSAFSYCDKITHITIPEGVTEIGYHAFSSCHYLTHATLPQSLTKIGKYAFLNCGRLLNLQLPESVTEIGKDAFCDCDDLTLSVTAGSYAEKYAQENGLLYIH